MLGAAGNKNADLTIIELFLEAGANVNAVKT